MACAGGKRVMSIVDLHGERSAIGLGLEITRLGKFAAGVDCC